MEIKITTSQLLKGLYIVSWILFLGVCVETGSFIFNAIFSVAFQPNAASYFDLMALYQYDRGHFIVVLTFMTIVGMMRVLMFYLIIRLLANKQLSVSKPFSEALCRFLFLLAYLSVGAGLFSAWGVDYTDWLEKKGLAIPDAQRLRLGGADIWLFMGIVVFVVAQIFKKGIEIQTENELTV